MATQEMPKPNALRLKFKAHYMKKRVIATEIFDSLRRENEKQKVA